MNAAIAIVLALAAVCSGTVTYGVPAVQGYGYTAASNVYVQQPQYQYVQQPQYQYVQQPQYAYKPVQTAATYYKAPAVQYTAGYPTYAASAAVPVVSTYGSSVYTPSVYGSSVYGFAK